MTDIQKLDLGKSGLTAWRTGAGPDLLIVHSLLADYTAFLPVLPWLAARYRVTLVNLPGFHGSKVIDKGIFNYGDHVAGIMDAAKLADGTTLIANGFGGTVALAMALRHGKRFGRLVLSDLAAGFPPQGRAAFEVMATKVTSEGIGSVATISAHRVFHEAYLAAHPEAIEQRRSVLMATAPEAFVAACETLMDTDLVSQLSDIKNDTLVICGELDAATPPALCRQVANNIAGARYIELPNCGHCPPLEQPDVFISSIAGFLEA